MFSRLAGEPLHLLRTKLYRPRPTGDVLHRMRLHQTLDRYLDRTVTLVCAPAGFGKTMMLTDWLEQCPAPSAWLSLDKGDGDLPVFLAYFVAAVRTLFPTACADTLKLLQAPVLPPLTSLVTALINDLDQLGDGDAGAQPSVAAAHGAGRFIVVLDDYHLVREPAVHSLLGALLRHPPRTLHVIIGTRQDPPFVEQALRARGDFSEIRGGELRFTPDEVASFMEQALRTKLNDNALEALLASTEGWGTGLRLTALGMRAGGDTRGLEAISYNRYTSEYLLAEVLAHVPVATQDFLLKTSILDRLTGPLCDAVAPPADPEWDGAAYLQWLATENIFTFSFGGQGNWYRYHHLFQKLLQMQLERRHSRGEIAGLHARAATWYSERGLLQEGIDHALAAGDELLAAELVEQHGQQAMNHERWRQLEQWLRLLPRRLIDARPALLLLEAWVVQNQWRFRDLPAYLDRIERLIEEEPLSDLVRKRLTGEVDSLRSIAYYYVLDWRCSVACAERALAALPLECSYARGNAYLYLPNGRLMAGDLQGALEAVQEALKEDRFHGNSFPTRPYMALCMFYWIRGDPVNLFLTATQMLQLGQQRELDEAIGWAHYFRGCARYQQNDLAAAEVEFGAVVGLRYIAHAFPFSQAGFGLVITLAGTGEFDRAREVLSSIAAYGLELNNGRVIVDAEAIRACLAQRTGSIAEAHHWAVSFDPKTPLVPLTTFSVPQMVRARVLVAEGSQPSLAAAALELARLRELATATFNTRYLMEVLALEAMIQDGQGDQRRAFDILEESLALAEPGDMIRVFLDLGPKMGRLLGQFARARGANEFRQRLLAAFGEITANQPPVGVAREGRPLVRQPVLGLQHPIEGELIEPLSRRELDVLVLLSQRLTDKEIARALFVSPQTVKRHASNIYQKLDVGNRRDAVAKAAALGVLPASQLVGLRPAPAY